MSEHSELQGLEQNLAAALPPVPSPEDLARVRRRAESARLRTAVGAGRSRQVWRAAGLAVAAAVLVLGVLVAGPALENRAFARDEAADALVFAKDGRVTHIVTHFTGTGWTEEYGHDERFDLDQRTEEWYDPAGQRAYSRTVNVADGSLDGVSVRVGGDEMLFQNNVRYGTGDAPQLLGGHTSVPFGSSIGMMTDQVRAEIDDGHAKVVGTEVVDGEECWLVSIDVNRLAVQHGGDKPDPKSSDVITVTLRKSDYLITTWERESVGYNGNGKTTTSMRLVFERWEHVSPEAVDDSMFSLDSVVKLAPAGTKIVKTVDGAAVE